MFQPIFEHAFVNVTFLCSDFAVAFWSVVCPCPHKLKLGASNDPLAISVPHTLIPLPLIHLSRFYFIVTALAMSAIIFELSMIDVTVGVNFKSPALSSVIDPLTFVNS